MYNPFCNELIIKHFMTSTMDFLDMVDSINKGSHPGKLARIDKIDRTRTFDTMEGRLNSQIFDRFTSPCIFYNLSTQLEQTHGCGHHDLTTKYIIKRLSNRW